MNDVGGADHAQGTNAHAVDVYIAFELYAYPIQDGFDVRTNRFKPFLAQDLDDGVARDIGRSTRQHLRIRPADELVSQVPATAGQHERRLVDHPFKVGVLRAQRLFAPLVFDEIGSLPGHNVEEPQRPLAGLLRCVLVVG